MLGAAEHQRVHHLRPQVFDEPGQQELLVALLHKIQALLDAVHRAGHRVYLDKGRVMQDACGQLLDLLGHGGAEHQVLALPGQLGDHLFHVVDKAHIQHTVGFVQNKDLNVGEVQQPLPHHALFQGLHLRGLAHTAKDDGAAQGQILAVGFKALADLQSQLPGRSQDQGADGTLFAGRAGSQAVEHGQRKGSRLAGTRLGAAHQVPPGQHRRNGRCLNGRGGFIARLCHSTQHRRGKIQFVKCHSSPKMFLHSI